ncbi:heme utilization protein [Pseudomonas mandelii]|uniref:heme utilization protein n=1 Tax=Pseudomonas mandelii TaxID=75612 RepID=UPI0020A09570|nr:heme utilization protein [Pseudomonas mandelii]MCO8314246.1 heme utilization protein [Pseudomonas mandelii]
MKPSMALKPLVFAIAAVMAVAVQAGQNDRHRPPPPTKIPVYATADAWDNQSSTDNSIRNEGTINEAEMNSSATGASGNVGVNVAAGSGNQQDNASAIANAASNSSLDNSFVFGTATATADVTQYSNNNTVNNFGSTASAVMNGSGNGGSGNMGINIAGGDLNQQKNTMAIANTNAPLGNATATASADQQGPGLVVNNYADRTTRLDTITVTTTASGNFSRDKASNLSVDRSASSSFDVSGSRSSDASGSRSSDVSGSRSSESSSTRSASLSANLDAAANATRTVTWNNGNGDRTRTRSVDVSVDASVDADFDASRERSSSSSFERSFDKSWARSSDSSFEKSGSKESESSFDKSKTFSESSSFDLSNTYSYQVLTPTGWANPVTNTATLNGSVNGGSGNLGVNVAAGVGNQQSNSLAISNNSF